MLKAYAIGMVIAIAVMVPAAQSQQVVLSQEQRTLFSLTATLGALQAVQRELLIRILFEMDWMLARTLFLEHKRIIIGYKTASLNKTFVQHGPPKTRLFHTAWTPILTVSPMGTSIA